MRNDAPAALPLIAFVAGLLCGSGVATAAGVAAIAALIWRWTREGSIAIAFVALGMLMAQRGGPHVDSMERFATIEAPIESDWSARDHVHVLRCSRFTANGIAFDAPLAIYARFDPPPIARQARVRVEGFLRQANGGRFTASVKSPRLLSYRGSISGSHPATWNRVAEQRLRRYAPAYPDEIAMIDALVLGRGERLGDETRQNFRRGGTYHLLVFSGLQIALAAAAIALALRWAGAPRISDWSLIAFAALAPPFIGPTASVSRASVAIAAYAISRVLKRPTSFENLWCVAALIRLIAVPGDLIDPAFQLTYAGAGALIFAGRPLASRMRWISYAMAAEIVITPLTLFHFHQFALGGSIMTLALTPIVLVMLMAGSLFLVTEWTVLLRIIAILNSVCAWLNDLSAPFSGFFAAPRDRALGAGLIAALVAIAFTAGRRRAVAVAIALLIPTTSAIARHVSLRNAVQPQITFLDVGQGDAILLRSGRRSVLVDGGGRSDDPRFGETVLLPLLVDRGVRHVDVIALSHAHPDHCGGLPAVIRQLGAGEVWINPRRFRDECAREMLGAIAATDTPLRLIRSRTAAKIGELRLDATVAQRGYRRAAENNASVVLRVESRGRSLLLTGDIEREAEAEMAPGIRPADVLKVPHHGSRSSSTPPLLDAARPTIAVISCGAHNWFGHPNPSVLESLAFRRVRTWRTDLNGSIELTIGRTIVLQPEFDTRR
ncbi:MAG TPA: DNA internalization-related competence protein ComEC/Rec2 [Thermoanaerobaculia bacterium]|nr:DNA internalization-related competence protein ComEC/Rec2 [Thermoanaerobaculia bacterium]